MTRRTALLTSALSVPLLSSGCGYVLYQSGAVAGAVVSMRGSP